MSRYEECLGLICQLLMCYKTNRPRSNRVRIESARVRGPNKVLDINWGNWCSMHLRPVIINKILNHTEITY